ncbi:hypothetical protein SCLCIDRAFT_29085 [Scleroderma citrinum Foug A]|uniref:DUF6532 domain-containing protein n=1 Tax=Scleroderma citrinum Foug A TaxID=1036808 RepID=A0A0C3DLN4_9AGAM|nr:hypothetical protein SCLCIDRAFT_29085 [Scleroderma citrinum Foug A]
MQLLAVCNQQTSEASHSAHRTAIDDMDDLETPISACLHPPPISQASLADVDPSPSQPKPTAVSIASGVMPEGNSNPSQLQFYTPPVCDIIEHAKQISHCDIASVNLFPLHVDFNHKATEYMNKVIAECRSRGLLIPKGWWPKYTSGITKLLWEDLGNWRSALKKKARTYVHEHYKWDAQNHCHVNTNTTRKLLECANAMANIFPEVFQDEVPCATVALVATAIKVALDEMVVEGKEVVFKHDV